MKHLVLIDGHHLMYRAYWAIPRTLKTRAGMQVNTVFGMASMLLAILANEEPDSLLICFDEGEETFRHEENETYKDGRAETPDDFYEQIPLVMELIEGFSFATASNPKYEADDLIASYAVAAEKEGQRVTIVSGDKDLFQLATPNIRIAIPHKGYSQTEYLHAPEVEVKLGVRPDQIPAYKGLCGDSSDNLPGVKGIGPKNAAKLLQEFHTLEGIYEHIGAHSKGIREKLEADQEQAFFCQRMAELVLDIELPLSLEELSLNDVPSAQILSSFQRFEFTLLTKRLQTLLATEYGQCHFDQTGITQDDIDAVFGKKEESKEQMTLF